MNERGTSRSDRFRFSLGLDAEDLSKDAALSALNARLAEARQAIQPLALGQLTIPAPRSYPVGGGAAGSRLERASTTITGEVSRDDYDALIQAAGRLPGRLQGMTSLAQPRHWLISCSNKLLRRGDVALRPQHGLSACARWSCC